VVGLAFALPALYFWKKGYIAKAMRKRVLIYGALIGFQVSWALECMHVDSEQQAQLFNLVVFFFSYTILILMKSCVGSPRDCDGEQRFGREERFDRDATCQPIQTSSTFQHSCDTIHTHAMGWPDTSYQTSTGSECNRSS